MGQKRAMIVFPAIAIAFSVSCASAGSAPFTAETTDQTTVPTSATKGATSAGLALEVLSKIPVRPALGGNVGYSRSKFSPDSDIDGDSCRTRAEVLIAESTTPAQVDMFGCKVLEGDWYSAYDGVSVTDPGELQVDHLVPLKEAWISGASSWSAEKRRQFANDLSDERLLVAVTGKSHAPKGDRGVDVWQPPNPAVLCAYLSDWVVVKSRWGLTVDEDEQDYLLGRFRGRCAGTRAAPWGSGTRIGAGTVGSAGAPAGSGGSTTSGQVSSTALDVLAGVPIRREQPAGYARSKFRHWVDADGDSCNTREEVLIAESTSPAQVDVFGCKVIEGDWYSTYDKVTVTDPSGLDVDHMVALKEAWDSGAGKWSAARREAFANDLSDPRALVAVTASSNRSKGDKDPPQWMPRNTAIHCTYLSDWVAVKSRWSLSMDESEYRFIEKRLKGQCAGTMLAPWGSTAASAPATTSPGTPVTTVPPSGSTVASTVAPATTAPAKGGTLPTVKPGAFCSPQGAQGTYSGTAYVCSTTKTDGTPYSDGRARWRRV